MVRIVGILCGSALAISSLIIALGVPEFLPGPLEAPEIDNEMPVAEILETVIEMPIEDPLETKDEPVERFEPVTQV